MADASPVQPLPNAKAMKKAYGDALIYWAVPLVIGLVIFGLFLYSQTQGTDWPDLGLAGLANILFGTVCVLLGMFKLLRFMILGYCDTDYPRLRLWGRATVAAMLLCSNFVVAYGMVTYRRYVERTRYNVLIWNDTSQTLPQVHVTGAGCDVDYGSIAPDSSVAHFFWIKAPGDLKVQTSNPNIPTALIGSVKPDQAGSMDVHFNHEGADAEVLIGRNIPEPSTYAITAGIVALGFAAWRRRQKAVARV